MWVDDTRHNRHDGTREAGHDFALSVEPVLTAGGRRFRVSAFDIDSGLLIGRCEIAATARGDPPALAPAELLERVGGRYRLAALRVDDALLRLSAANQRVARFRAGRARRLRRWRSRMPAT
ncbi:hypothetical protein [Rhodovulum sp. PH10]|uniref:hypothetical protein n=1 Tax=Rhodovulum sp. PH10 TaxID=1187851 RepID=UPI00058D9A6D|nr:hypothetical protein [Rhodovulum sp. PH10]